MKRTNQSLILMILGTVLLAPVTLAAEKSVVPRLESNPAPLLIADSALQNSLQKITRANPEVAGLRFQKITDFESSKPGLGYGAKWVGEKAVLDIYLYTLGLQDIGNSPQTPDMETAIKSALSEMTWAKNTGRYDAVEVGEASTKTLGGRTYVYVPVSITWRGRELDSVLLMTAIQGKIFKLRFSTEKSPTSQALIESVLKAVPRLVPAS